MTLTNHLLRLWGIRHIRAIAMSKDALAVVCFITLVTLIALGFIGDRCRGAGKPNWNAERQVCE